MALTEVRGEVPPVVGEICEELICQQLWSDGALEDPGNVIFLRVRGRWFRLYFDFGEIVWNPGAAAPQPWAVPELGVEYPLFDVAARFELKGLRVASIRTEPIRGGAEPDPRLRRRPAARLPQRRLDHELGPAEVGAGNGPSPRRAVAGRAPPPRSAAEGGFGSGGEGGGSARAPRASRQSLRGEAGRRVRVPPIRSVPRAAAAHEAGPRGGGDARRAQAA